ncbi:ATP-binding protein [Geobacter pelophilus]|uniref:ATP-binding protein n=1 Tax=Geoanaerobacter pelophilus TaxID=60036 RepID=A0AAW4KYY6_9BACT|nr:ATP-binding protein [Geoanaerobacter pelophilus]MBT0663137.1 ATP-binding protein [Geoanaerobacter pelophilus]
MPDAMLKTSLAGKIRHLRPFKTEALLPVFEAVVNSIQAIEEMGDVRQGVITVRIRRDMRQGNLAFNDEDSSLPNIIGFEIEDNGIGFNNDNYESFQTADSTYKIAKGGKGVGRFLWLKAFERVDITSIYLSPDGTLTGRNIEFTITDGIRELTSHPFNIDHANTIVRLTGFKEEYRKLPSAFKSSPKIAQRIFEHCLTRFISDRAPTIKIIDDWDGVLINLHDLYNKIKGHIVTEDFSVRDSSFTMYHIRLYETHEKAHQLVYCADGRDVKNRSIGSLLGTSVQFDDDGKKFFYSAYITSPFLDANVDEYRQEFNIPDKNNLYSSDEISMEQIEQEAVQRTRTHLAPVIESVEKQKAEKVSKFLQNQAPMLRSVVKYCPEAMKEIEVNTTEEKMTQTLYAYKGKAEYEIRKNSDKLLRTQAKSVEEIDVQYKELTEKLEDLQKDQLAGYVLFRKMIIDLLDKKLCLNSDRKYCNEDIVHDIVFPRKTDTDTIGYENHNLWLIDELLAFHSLAASDKRLCDITTSSSEERPDVVVFSEVGDDRMARAISLIEFKKPQRTNFDEDPTKQLFRYVREIRKNGVWLPNGRQVTVNDTTRFYCYAICDLTPQVKEFAENGNYAALQGELGYYTYNRNHNAHVELVAFDKIVLDAKQRHKAFFEKLGIGS